MADSGFIPPSSSPTTTVSQHLAVSSGTSIRVGGVFNAPDDSRVRISVSATDSEDARVASTFSFELPLLDATLLRAMIDDTLRGLAHAQLSFQDLEEKKRKSLDWLFAETPEPAERETEPEAPVSGPSVEEGIQNDHVLTAVFSGNAQAEPTLQ